MTGNGAAARAQVKGGLHTHARAAPIPVAEARKDTPRYARYPVHVWVHYSITSLGVLGTFMRPLSASHWQRPDPHGAD